MTVNLKSFFTLDKVEFTKEELELPYENTSKDSNQQNKICSKTEKTQNIMEMIILILSIILLIAVLISLQLYPVVVIPICMIISCVYVYEFL